MDSITKRIKYTPQGYNYIKVTPGENFDWGGMCICNSCFKQFIKDDMYLVFVLGDTYCEKCFNEWVETVKTYKEDLKFQADNSLAYYEAHLS